HRDSRQERLPLAPDYADRNLACAASYSGAEGSPNTAATSCQLSASPGPTPARSRAGSGAARRLAGSPALCRGAPATSAPPFPSRRPTDRAGRPGGLRTTAPWSRVRRWTSTSISGVSYLPPESGDVLGIGTGIIRAGGSGGKLLEVAAAHTVAAFGVGAAVRDGSVADGAADGLFTPACFRGGFRGIELGVVVDLCRSNQLAQ